MKRLILVLAAVGFSTAANSQDMASVETAKNLGSVLASESECGLSFDQGAIGDYVANNVAAEDMGFSSLLSSMTSLGAHQFKGMSESGKTAHCAQITRVAKSYGFIE